MKNIDGMFLAALKKELESAPRGTKARLSEMLGIVQSQLTDIIKERRPSQEEQRRAIADYFNYSYEDFLTRGQAILVGEEPPLPQPPESSVEVAAAIPSPAYEETIATQKEFILHLRRQVMALEEENKYQAKRIKAMEMENKMLWEKIDRSAAGGSGAGAASRPEENAPDADSAER